jgi:hypothetical protein
LPGVAHWVESTVGASLSPSAKMVQSGMPVWSIEGQRAW